jgi:hypothetical protein
MKLIIKIYIFIISFLVPMCAVYASEHKPEIEAFAELRSTMCAADGRSLVTNLHVNYGERVFALSAGTSVGIGGIASGVQLIYLRNPETKTFTVLEFHASGKGCIVAGGHNFEFVDMELQKPKVPESKI